MDIKISFSGQYLNQSGHITSFQEGDSGWVKKLFNPRECGRDIFKNKDIEKCYAVWYDSDNGCNYSLIMKSPDTSTRDGFIMIVLCTGEKIFANGSDVLSLLEQLRHLFIDTKYTSVQNLNEVCSSKVEELAKAVSLSNDRTYHNSHDLKGKAFRSYNGEEELAMILQHPNQREYVHYERIFILPSSNYSELSSNGYSEITSPIKKVYNIKTPLPDGVSVDAERLYEDDILRITYSKSGCESQPVSVRLNGKYDPHIAYLNNEVEILSAHDANIKFKKGICIKCLSDDNRQVKDISIRVNGIRYQDSENRFTFDDSCETYEIDVVSNDYKDEHVVIEPVDFECGIKTVNLVSKTHQLELKFDTGNKKIKGKVSIKATDPLYPYLLKASQQGLAITLQETHDDSQDTNGENPTGPNRKGVFYKWCNYIGISLIGVILIYLLYAIDCNTDGNTYPWPFSQKQPTEISKVAYNCSHEECECSDCVTEEGSECTCTCEACKPAAEEIAADIKYLKEHDEWSKEELASDKYKELMDYINKGQIDDIIQKKWFDVNDPINGFWSANNDGIYELLNKISVDPEKKRKAVDCLKNAFSNGKLPLSSLKKSLQNIVNPPESKTDTRFESPKKEEKIVKKEKVVKASNGDEGKRPGAHQ